MPCDSTIATLTAEGLIGLGAAARLVSVHPATLTRWCHRGAKTPTGERVHLEHVRLPGRIMTTEAAVHRFLTAIGTATPAATTTRTPAKRRKAAEDAEAELRRMGV
jgi:hypothetical protein